MEPSEQERATEWVTPAEVMAKINAVSRQPVREGNEDQRGGTRGAASTRSGRLRSLESHAPFPPLESRESGGRLCWEAWSLRESTAWARNHVHACNHALPRLRAFWFLGGSGAASERQTEKKGSEQLCTAKTSPKPKLGPCLRCKSCGAGGKTHYCREQLLRRL